MDLLNFLNPGTPMSDDASIRTDAIATNIPEDPASGGNTDVIGALVRNAKAAAAGAFLQTDVGKSLAAEAEKQKIQERVAQVMPAAVVAGIAVLAIVLLMLARR